MLFRSKSNIHAVLYFIETKNRHSSQSNKEFAIKKELGLIRGRIDVQVGQILNSYGKLEEILKSFQIDAQKVFDELKSRYANELSLSYAKIESIIDRVASEIFTNIENEIRVRYEEQKSGLLGKKTFVPIEYSVCKINADNIYKKLFYDDELVGQMFKTDVRG